MYRQVLFRPNENLRTALCLGSHCDDIEIGCGGTILRMARDNPGLVIHWVVFSSDPVRADEARIAASEFLAGFGEVEVVIRDFRNAFFPYVATAIKEFFEELKARISPDVIFTHYGKDLHQDHRVNLELTWNTGSSAESVGRIYCQASQKAGNKGLEGDLET